MGLKGGRDWLLRIAVKAKNDKFDKSSFVVFVVVVLNHGLWENIVHP